MHFVKQKFLELDGPTWVVAIVLYGAWILLVWFNAVLPWWVIIPVGGYLLAWHFSLQHEAIHAFRGVPAWLRFAVVLPPLGLLRAFTEHRAAVDSQERTASVESNTLFGVMYLYNDLHVAHHLKPCMPWYEIPRFYRDNSAELLANNGQFVYQGYGVLARRYFWRPCSVPFIPLCRTRIAR